MSFILGVSFSISLRVFYDYNPDTHTQSSGMIEEVSMESVGRENGLVSALDNLDEELKLKKNFCCNIETLYVRLTLYPSR